MINEHVAKWLGAGAILLVIVLVIAQLFSHSLIQRMNSFPDRQGWHAVFLSNGQVYFGKITHENDSRLVLQEIYYIQLPPNGQPQKTSNQSDVSLLKLGNEIHGPEDSMEINRDHILFIEKLKEDGKVVKAIQAYK